MRVEQHKRREPNQSTEDRLKTAKAVQLREREQSRRNVRSNPEGLAHTWIGLMTAGTFILLLVGISGISPDTGPVASLRNIVMSALGAALVFGVGYFSIRVGAERVAVGDRTMLVLCLAGFLAAGLIIAPTTYFAMAKKIAAEISLTDHGQEIKARIEAANRAAIESQTIKPVVVSAHADVRDKESCERARGCLTGRPYTGSGPAPVSDFLGGAADRFGRAVRAIEAAEANRDGLIRDLNRAGDRFNDIASDRSQKAQDRRKALIALDSEIRDKLAQLEQVSPRRLLMSLSRDLRASVGGETNSDGQRSGMERAVGIVRGHALLLDNALGELKADLVPLPPFPGPVSLASSFSASVLPNTLPYLLLAIFIECSGVFCFLLCVKYQRGLLLDHLALMEFEGHGTGRESRASHRYSGSKANGADKAHNAKSYRTSSGHHRTNARRS